MGGRRGEWVAALAVRFVRISERRPRAVLLATLAFAAAALACAVLRLGIDADPQALLDPDLPFQVRDRAFAEHFPVLNNALLVVVDGPDGESARSAARALAERLRARADRFTEVYVPGAAPFFERNALLYRSVPELEQFSEHMARIQPVLGELSASPDLQTLSRVLRLGIDSAAGDPAAAAQLSGVLDQLSRAAALVYAERPLFVSWEGALLGGTSFDPTRRAVIVAQPVLDFERVLAAAPAIDAIRSDAAALSLRPEHGIEVRITGYPALNHEEMLGLVWDVGLSGVASFAIVLALLFAAFRCVPVVIAAASTLLVGLAVTAGFAALAVGSLNLVSIAFAVMFIGLGVDYSIHLGLHYLDARRAGRAHGPALEAATREVGEALLLCTGTTAIGFLSFVPTDYRGVGELGLISAAGMLVILTLTLSFLPALLGTWCHVDSPPPLRRGEGRVGRLIQRRAGSVAALALVIAIASAILAPRVRFDSNVVEMRNPDTESVRAFNDLLADSHASPWYIDVLEPSLEAAERKAAALAALPEVERVATLRDYVPGDQAEKREILADTALLLGPAPRAAQRFSPGPEEELAALRELAAALDVEWVRTSQTPLARSAELLRSELGTLLARLEQEPDSSEALARFEEMLLGRLPERLDQLRRMLDPEEVTLDSLPHELRERMISEDGSARIQVFPRDDLTDDRALERFVAAVRAKAPEAGGLPVNVVEFGRATSRSLRDASLLAFGSIALVLFLLWRRPVEVALVLTPLALAGASTIACMVLVDMPFNFANVIVLPLVLGMGVDSGIHLVERARLHGDAPDTLSDSTTARAILFSALTTLTSFSNLALSGHRGIQSLGILLTLGMAGMLASTLLVLPALIALRARRRSGRA